MVKNLPANSGITRDTGSIPESGRAPGVGNGNPLQYSCLENPMDRGTWRAIVHGVERLQRVRHDEHHTGTRRSDGTKEGDGHGAPATGLGAVKTDHSEAGRGRP